MGVRRLFSRGGQKHTICLKNTKKLTIFLEKAEKHTKLASQRGQGPPLALPCGRPWAQTVQNFSTYNSIYGMSKSSTKAENGDKY
jgi:hypothetical protein